ncbi:Bug family tripartite tricarboxylate transporter substrate binding protein [Aquabacter spiritensis]|uniref:Tripartite-type tricarboxylate transporter receptor subunit TctC n=1 Tax=Aquabacter spiritensis TaxID=933073 RepID=A0A4R3LV88_9HYPH|nr:tripartite tricarboxylate transporter substrate binding protein [Aquabacter spiritensis]TCT03579.1 tripartite-type tricarboxylate transporter receptor subunit TctC [Aquabacter spiritensis]
MTTFARMRTVLPRLLAATALVAGLAAALPNEAAAQADYPSKPIRLIVPFPPGESLDAVARSVAEPWSKALGQSIVVDNRPGAGGMTGTEAGAKAAPDGYTILMSNIGALAILPAVNPRTPYDVLKDLTPISLIANVPFFLFVGATQPFQTVNDLVDYAKKNPGKLNYASTGIGSGVHLAGELFKAQEKIDIVHVPYKGVSQALPDIISGSIQMVFYPITFLPQVKAGQLRPLMITATKRVDVLPDVKTSAELGMPNMIAGSWHMILVPAGTPQPIIDKLSKTLMATLAEPALQARLLTLGAEPVGGTPAEAKAFLEAEMAKWRDVAKTSNITMQ